MSLTDRLGIIHLQCRLIQQLIADAGECEGSIRATTLFTQARDEAARVVGALRPLLAKHDPIAQDHRISA
jgi:hypothetical protein